MTRPHANPRAADHPASEQAIRRFFQRFVRWRLPRPDERPPRDPPPGYTTVVITCLDREGREMVYWMETPKRPALKLA